MIIEQVRYFVQDEDRIDEAAEIRREIDNVRMSLGLPAGHILVADPPPDDAPALVWQCGYENESMLAVAEATIAGSTDYAAGRDRLSALVSRTEIELYTADEVAAKA
ncbi:MAG TPA: hypothetical protein VG815_10600 [Chloroflexota bacterium]|nr:hypothetical protein [Chloroflexota bacterium]